MKETERSAAKVQSILRAANILKCFTPGAELGVSEIAEQVGLHKSTAFGLISSLTSCGFLRHNPENGKYAIGLELFRLGQMYNADLERIIRPYLDRLVNEFQETVNYVVLDGQNIVYINKIDSPYSMRISTAPCQRRPLYCTGAGKAILAFLPEEEQKRILDNTEFIIYTSTTIRSRQELEKELAEIRSQGYAEDRGEAEIGLWCVAVPIFGQDGNPVGAISVAGPDIRMTDDIKRALIQRLRAFSLEISTQHRGYVPNNGRLVLPYPHAPRGVWIFFCAN